MLTKEELDELVILTKESVQDFYKLPLEEQEAQLEEFRRAKRDLVRDKRDSEVRRKSEKACG